MFCTNGIFSASLKLLSAFGLPFLSVSYPALSSCSDNFSIIFLIKAGLRSNWFNACLTLASKASQSVYKSSPIVSNASFISSCCFLPSVSSAIFVLGSLLLLSASIINAEYEYKF